MTYPQIDLVSTLKKTNKRITQKFIADTLGVSSVVVNQWVRNNHVPTEAKNRRLIGFFQENNVIPDFKE
jgi:transcriptional regulator with XRE-family HTH domain